MLKEGFTIVKNKGINFIYKNGKRIKHKPWLADLFSFLYDKIMEKSVFPKKFAASYSRHLNFLQNEMKNTHNRTVIELATGSGNLADLLPNDNKYTGTDISKGLLKKACKRFIKSGFDEFELYECNAEELPFSGNQYDMAVCNLSLNFFSDINKAIDELYRILKPQGIFICSIPVPERKPKNSVIHGNLYSEKDLKQLLENKHFVFAPYPEINGALLYFKAIKNTDIPR